MTVNIWKSYMCTAVEETNIEAIFAVMNTTELEVEIRAGKNSGPYGIWTHDLCDTDTWPELFSGLIFTSSSIAFITSRIAFIFEWTSNLNTPQGITECGIENFQFIVWERAQGNPDNSRAMSALTLLLFKSNTLHKETLHWNFYILGKPDKMSKLLRTRKNTSTNMPWMKNLKFVTFPFKTNIPQ